ncbi:HlyD family secretion protein [Stenotrophomonas sp. SM006]|uniref:HlyD family secretion protein n=1 Tax=Stenotrophomonas sp. ASS1 TaxID=2282124 RepID=UPI001049C5D4|nr:HlyD family efflux transporter periplasmic adaptor subunit [Stenotrophomonas sp. ASS1]NED65522.1 HlyD family efflux transporter periplasmic adaptor subunit [Streptomyces sp. SID10244]QBL42227.1 HlyD family efflux transporter periplasmic adaptor subunit [Stenotrophomonas sp. ASS1]
MTLLFRQEAVDAKRGNQLGSISLVQPVRAWLLAAFCLLSASALVCYLVMGEYTRRSRVSGELVPDLGLSTVMAPSAGVIASLATEEGDHANRGDGLVLVNVPRITGSGDDASQALLNAQQSRIASSARLIDSQNRQMATQLVGITEQRNTLLQEISQIELEIRTRGDQVRLGRETLQRYQRVADQRYVSLVQVNQQEQSLLEMVNARQLLQRQATTLRRSLAELDQRIAEIPRQREAGIAAFARDTAALEQERIRMETDGAIMLRAPVSGVIANRMVEPGQAVEAGQAVLSIVPDGSLLRAQLLAPSSAIGFIKAGDRVLLRYQAYPYQKFGTHEGTILRVSRSALISGSTSTDSTDSVYRVLVALDQQAVLAYGRSEPLRPGMKLEADILGERRKLYEWLLEPLYSLTGSISVAGVSSQRSVEGN